ncbi:phosphoglucosamine mutase [Leptospira bandrabouensis]|uniref:phosphoglucosamine mutase n=1 Tax=Leptospira bandrabouensis TaxID=2484903 RepID=UPI001EE79DE9|nr:phosphoglucosamine mutase [Leptospira bandrabouensis]MCG6143498.1 phosphoglucosamine mutase [Leptospira bandrabouensis]MCG6151460.1 phosphoglucosamine mutase [Leptospira bandrabouensis]MCG6159158.1 phosphoglucosamine mutase [Leptospira bandrabouensis]MCG6163092.1 phosphoglucosamine mutase [Leptospira bandrabouensis]
MRFTKEYDLSSLMISISGVRGKIGLGFGLDEALAFSKSFASMMNGGTAVIGRDSRPSGPYLESLLTSALLASGNSVLTLGLVPTPTTKAVVNLSKANGGIMISASHNPMDWNAFKFISKKGFFFSAEENKKLLSIIQNGTYPKEQISPEGYIDSGEDYIDLHLSSVLKRVNVAKIKKKKFTVFVDAVGGAGSYVVPKFLQMLGCRVVAHNCNPDGTFPRPPEPTAAALKSVEPYFKKSKADIGFALDPDADRLVLFSPKRGAVSEEYTLPLALMNVLSTAKKKAKVVVNLSTSFLNEEVGSRFGAEVIRSKVGEANVVEEMLKTKAAFGGEGNGGVIDPTIPSFGRDTLSGIAHILNLMAETGKTVDALLDELPSLYMDKQSFPLAKGMSLESLYEKFQSEFSPKVISEKDGLWMYVSDSWIHIRPSNTEPIFRVITETKSKSDLETTLKRVKQCVES